MVDASNRHVIACLTEQPRLGLELWALVEPERARELADARWRVLAHDSPLGVILTVHDRASLERHTTAERSGEPPAEYVLVFDHLDAPDPERLYAWPEVLAVARYYYKAPGRLFAVSLDDTILAWAHDLFTREPQLRPLLVGPATLAQLSSRRGPGWEIPALDPARV